jgi:ComF family protein
MKALGQSLQTSLNGLIQSGLGQVAANLLTALRDTAFPPGCAACGDGLKNEGPFCEACAEQARVFINPVNSRYKASSQSCDSAKALAVYDGPVGRAVRAFKYNRRLAAGAALAQWLARETPPEWLSGIDLIAPVPLHPRRLLKRGFNQAVLLFKHLSQKYNVPLACNLLLRLRNTRPQVDLSPQERKSNVAGAFGVRRPGQALKRKVLVVDDVYTTGATVNECALALKEAEANEVRVLTLARTISNREEPV